jgi:hypothetical protein
MSFTGTPIFEQLTPNLIRITELTLDSLASGTIGLHESTGSPDVRLPASFKAPALSFDGDPVSLAARILISIEPISGAPGPLTNLPPSREKTGTTPEDFLVTVTNTNTSLPTQTLEIYVQAVTKARRGVRVGPVIGPTITIVEGSLDAEDED